MDRDQDDRRHRLERLYTSRDLMQILQIGPQKLLKLIHRGDLVALKVGSEWRVRQQDLDSYLEALQTNR